MKRKRSELLDDPQFYDLVLTDAQGRSVRAHKALLMDKSDYFADLLRENNLNILQLNENYLIELIQYLYNQENDDPTAARSLQVYALREKGLASNEDVRNVDQELSIANGDIEILMQLLYLSKKYGFRQLYANLIAEINYKLSPTTVLTIFKCALKLDLKDLQNSSIMMILSCLPLLQTSQEFTSLPEGAIHDIFSAESWDIENESKLNALSVWWSHNKDADMTSLWAKLITCSHK